MIIPRMAVKNLLGAGLRTWLNVVVLSFSFVIIIWTQGLYNGMGEQASKAMIEAEIAGGQYWQENYDPYDPLSLPDAHGVLPDHIRQLQSENKAAPVLIVQGTIYPNGRIQSVLVKGIDPQQTVVSIPSHFLEPNGEDLPALIGARMAKSSGLKTGDYVTVQWRDVNGTFDARDVRIVQVMKTQVPTIDMGQLWLPLQPLQELTGMEDQATVVTLAQDTVEFPQLSGWTVKNLDFLLQDVKNLVQSKSAGASIIYAVLLALAMLAIFNTQVLSIFRRRKEMGTLMALGFTRFNVIKLFTLEGAMHSVLAALIGAAYGLPLLIWFDKTGWAMPEAADSYGFALGQKLFPAYSVGLVLATMLFVMLLTTFVSFLPTRKIAKLKPTDALRGKMT